MAIGGCLVHWSIQNVVRQSPHADSAARVFRKRKDYGNTQWDTTSAAIAEIGH